MFHEPTFWVAVAFVLFIGVLTYLKVPNRIIGVLDLRARKIKSDLDEAEQLLKDAQDLLATYQKKQRDASQEADDIRRRSETEVARMTEQGQAQLEESLARREKLAVERIAQAEATALIEIRARTVDIAIDAAHDLLAERLPKKTAKTMIDEAIKSFGERMQ